MREALIFLAGSFFGGSVGVFLVAAVRAGSVADDLQQRFEQEELERMMFGSGPRPPRPHPSQPFRKG